MKLLRNAALVLVLALPAWPALSHHSFAMFDQTQRVTLQGTVSQIQWTNPHAFIQLDVAGKDGNAGRWDVELNSPNNLKRQGWRHSSLKAGDKITLRMNPLRSGKAGGLFLDLKKADGTVLDSGLPKNGEAVNVPQL